jgi:hypothetical protein
MEIDACTYENDPQAFHENSGKKLPYSLCDRNELNIDVELEQNCEARIPNKSLLFLYKLKALRDRQFDLEERGGVLGSERQAWLRSKIIKVVKQSINPVILRELIQELGLEFCLESVSNLPLIEASCLQYRN